MSFRLRIIAPCLLFIAVAMGISLLWWWSAPPQAMGRLFFPTAAFLLIGMPMALMSGLLFLTEQGVLRPLKQLSLASHQIARGNQATELPPKTGAEIGQLVADFEAMGTGIERQINQLKEGQMRLNAIINNSVEALISADKKGTLHFFNKAAEGIFGYTESEIIGKNITTLMPSPHRNAHGSHIKNYLEGGENKRIDMGQETKGMRKNGEVFPIAVSVAEITIGGERLFVGSILDITLQKHADSELAKHRENLRNMIHERTKDLKIAMEKAEAANLAKSNFISNISHEIRTPMNAMLGFLSLALEDEMIPAEPRDSLKVAHQSAWSLLGLFDDILSISKLDEGRMALENSPFDLIRLLEEVVGTMELAAREKGLSLTLSMPPPFPRYRSGDPMRLRQALFNLLSNAIKFTRKGEVEVQALAMEGDSIHFFIKDTGIGIPEALLKHIFEPFAQVDDSSTRLYGGTGLGTSISKQLIELMGGTLWVESQVGKGSTFHITLALPEVKAPQPPTALKNRPHAPRAMESHAILVAEDIEENAKLITIRLKQKGHTTTEVANGNELLEALTRAPHDLILMDVHMPELDGLEATRRIRSGHGTTPRHIPIIGLTASAGQQDIKACLAAGMDAVVAKPINFQHLFETMAAALSPGDIESLEPPSDRWPPIDGVDTQRAMAAWLDHARYLEALDSFVHKFENAPHAMRQAMEIDNTESLCEVLHAIKGASGNLCMTEVHAACVALSPLVAAGDKTAMDPLLMTLETAFHHLSQALPEKEKHTHSTRHPEIPTSQRHDWFKALLLALGTDNPDRVEPLLEPQVACVSTASAKKIRDRVNAFDFQGAETIVRLAAHELNIPLNDEAQCDQT